MTEKPQPKNETRSRRFRIAFVGGGINSAVGYAHFVAIRLDGLADIVAGCFSTDQAENAASADRYGVPDDRTYKSWQELLARETGNVDVVVVLTPIPTHKEIVIAALKAGYSVICEKALTTSTNDCIEIREAVLKYKGFLAVTYNYTGYPMVRELERIIRDGKLGAVQHIQIEMPQQSFALPGASPQSWRLQDYEVSTVSLDLGSHVFNLIRFLTDNREPIEVVSSQYNHGRFSGLNDNISCMIKYEGNLHVNAWWGKTALGHTNGLRIRVFGSEGSAAWLQSEPEVLHLADINGINSRIERGDRSLIEASLPRYERFKAGHPAGFIEAFANLYNDIFVSIASRSPNKFVSDSTEALENLHCLEAIELSSETQRWEALNTASLQRPPTKATD